MRLLVYFVTWLNFAFHVSFLAALVTRILQRLNVAVDEECNFTL